MRILIILTVLVAFACGDDDNPMAPTPTPEPDPAEKLIGTWKYTGNDFDAKLTANLREYLIGEGLTASQADMVISDMLGDTNLTFSLTLDFRSDGTVIADGEQPDRFQVSGNRISNTTSDGETFSVGYTVTDSALSLQFAVASLAATLGLEAEDEEEAELLRIMFMGIEVMTMYFSR